MSTEQLPERCDLLVVGSGAAGFAAAISAAKHGLNPIIIEKAEWFGGSTALSGGAIWCPGNHLMEAAGMKDDRAAARRYLQIEAGDRFNAELVDSFLENGPKAIRFFHEETALQMTHRPYSPDYHPDFEGAALGGRALDPVEHDGLRLGKELTRLRPPIPEFTILGGLQLGRMGLYHFTRMTRQLKSFIWATQTVLGYYKDRLIHGRDTKIKLGAALVTRLAETAFELGIPVLTRHELRSIERDAQGRVVAAVVTTPQGDKRIATDRGVVLAAGGFPQDAVRRAKTVPHVQQGLPHYSMAPESSTGGALTAAEAAGAHFLTSNSDAASWAPVSLIPQADGSKRPFPHLFMDRAKPGVMAVARDGSRFTNEALSYHDFVQNMVAKLLADQQKSAWLICDHAALRRYGLGAVPCAPGRIGSFLRSGYLKTGATVDELAQATGIDAAGLESTIAQFNGPAERGEDPAFGKGSTPYQTALGDPDHQPNQCVKPLEGRLYAVEIFPGDIGTTMGLDINAYGEVRDRDALVIPGLYAVGNDANSLMSGSYPGAGITLGPALTFGYLVGRRAAGVEA
ncbi:MAG: FAD-dependent oxidoreductase [Burkholderiaceae bacterium]|nr:FAD-dependent oxidoreductase [Burkholderiaceae bacterium]